MIVCEAATADKSGVDLYRSNDAGHTWAGPFAIERGKPHIDFAGGIFLSPDYRSDHTLYVDTFVGGAYVSSDNGVTFTALNATNPIAALNVTTFLDGEPGVAARRPELIAAYGAPPAGCCDMIFDPLLPARSTTPNPLARSAYYIVPPDYASTHRAVMLSQQPDVGALPAQSVTGHARAYGCTGEFVCTTMLYDFPPLPGDNTTRIAWNGPTYYPSSPDNYTVVESGQRGVFNAYPRMRVYRSTDFGHTWALWTSVTKLLTPYYGGEEAFINASPDAPHRLFLRLAGGFNPTSIPDEQLYRSDDNGTTWHRVACGWGGEEKRRYRCTLPFNALPFAYGTTVVEPGGRLYLVGEHDTGKHVDYVGLYCSRDYGAHWSTSC